MFSFLHVEALRFYPVAGSVLLEFTMAKFPDLHFDSKTTSCVGSFQEWNTALYLPPNHRRHFSVLTKIDLIHRKTDLTRAKMNRTLFKTCEKPVRSVRSQQPWHKQKTTAKSEGTARRRRVARSRVALRGAVSPAQSSSPSPLLRSDVVPSSGPGCGWKALRQQPAVHPPLEELCLVKRRTEQKKQHVDLRDCASVTCGLTHVKRIYLDEQKESMG